MRADLVKQIDPQGIYTGVQAISLCGIPKSTFYRYVSENRIPKHKRLVDGKTVFLGKELLRILTNTTPIIPEFMIRPKRGRPKKQANP